MAIWLAQEPDFDQFQANLSEAKNLYSGGAEQISKVSVPDGIKLSDTALDALIAKGYQNIETSDQVLDELAHLAPPNGAVQALVHGLVKGDRHFFMHCDLLNTLYVLHFTVHQWR